MEVLNFENVEILNLEIQHRDWTPIVKEDLPLILDIVKEDRMEGLYAVVDEMPPLISEDVEKIPSFSYDDEDDGDLVLPWKMDPDDWRAIDDVKGGALDVKEVARARDTEMAYVHERRIYDYSTKDECRRVTGKNPINVRWVDTMKDSGIRARLVAMEFRLKHEAAIFAGTPPLESMRALMRIAASGMGEEEPLCVMNLDVSRAHFYAKAKRAVYVALPPEDPRSQDPNVCGKLLFSMYGTRDAASNWEEEYSEFMGTLGMKKGVASPCHFYDEKEQIRILVHGDDFLGVGTERQLRALVEKIMEQYEARYEIIGPAEHLQKRTKIIGRFVTFTDEGIDIEVDPKYVQDAIKAYHLEDSNPVLSPAAKGKVESREERSQMLLRRVLGTSRRKQAQGDEEMGELPEEDIDERVELQGEAATKYKSIAAKLNFVSPDRPEVLFATKECMRAMAKPTDDDESKLVRLIRYLKGRPREVLRMPKNADLDVVLVYVDADFAGCHRTRRSTCGGCILWGGGMLKAWSKTITTLALSSGESELAAMTKGAAEGLGMQAVLEDLASRFGSRSIPMPQRRLA